jgi:hypothetical protein
VAEHTHLLVCRLKKEDEEKEREQEMETLEKE